jgi:thioredoxin reductase
VGLEAALRARVEGYEVALYEAASVGEHFRRYGPVRLFTPFHRNSTELGRARLRAAGVKLPAEDEILTGAQLRERYLLPLAGLEELSGAVVEGARVSAIAREGFTKGRSGDSRADRPFLLRIEDSSGPRLERADAVIDASGVYATPNATGPGGLTAIGEESLGASLEHGIPDLLGEARSRYAGKRILLVGDGRSAANAIADLDELRQPGGEGGRTRVDWVHRERGGSAFSPIPQAELDQLPVLRELDERAGRIARESTWIQRHEGATIRSYRVLPSGQIEVTLADEAGKERRLEVDRVLALVGYRPDLSIFRELQIHLCYASEGPMALAAAILSSQAGDPASAKGCLDQVPHGPESLKSPEPDFYVLGAKSYGRNPNFLVSLGHRQIEDVMTLLGAAEARLNAAAR